MDRRSVALVVAALVLLSGCSVLAGDDDPTVTPDPTDGTPGSTSTATPGTADGAQSATRTPGRSPTPFPTPTPARSESLEPLSAMDLPPGVEASGVDVETLLAAHRERLGSAPSRAQYTVGDANGTASGTEVRVVDDTSARSVRIDDPRRAGFLELYVGEGELGSRNTTSGEVMYGSGPLPTREFTLSVLAAVRRTPRRYVATVEWAAVGVSTAGTGTPRAVLVPTGVATADSPTGGDVTDVTGRMLVTSQGRIANVTLRVDVEGPDGTTATRGIDYATDRYGTAAVDRPGWLSTPPNLQSSVAAGGRLLRFEHTGGTAIPAGTRLNVTSGLSRVGTVRVDDRVGPGDALYVYRTAEGDDGQVRAAVGARPALPDDAAAFAGTVTVEGWVGDYQFQSAVDTGSDGETGARSTRPRRR